LEGYGRAGMRPDEEALEDNDF
jgi:hypothetical protein